MESVEQHNGFLSSDGHLIVRFRKSIQRIPLHTILYIESNLRIAIVHSTLGTFQCYQKLNDLTAALESSGFVRCHQSYLVSVNKVTSYTNLQAYIQDIKLPVSRRYQQAFQQQLAEVFRKKYGSLICTHGVYSGSHIRIFPEKEICIGRDNEQADLIINLPMVSRSHCTILYHHAEMTYEVTDHSTNGTFVDGSRRLLPQETYILQSGSRRCTGSFEDTSKNRRLAGVCHGNYAWGKLCSAGRRKLYRARRKYGCCPAI